jgi:hypothetical protein
MKFTPPTTNGMSALELLQREIEQDHTATQSWRKTAQKYGLFPNMARMIAMGYEPGPRIRARLGLPQVANVVVIEGRVPAGSQAIAAEQCPCGQWFISNHPRRRKCFICSPYKRRVKQKSPAQ